MGMNEVLSDFKTNSLTIREVFESVYYFQIPDYQRPYSWADEEIDQLWDDVYSSFESGDKYYFLGPLILAQTNKDTLKL